MLQHLEYRTKQENIEVVEIFKGITNTYCIYEGLDIGVLKGNQCWYDLPRLSLLEQEVPNQ